MLLIPSVSLALTQFKNIFVLYISCEGATSGNFVSGFNKKTFGIYPANDGPKTVQLFPAGNSDAWNTG